MPAKTSLSIVRTVDELCTSTIGLSPETVTVSATAATRKSALIVAMNVADSSTLSRRNVVNPASENVTTYVPARRSTMRYCPAPSVTTDRLCSISDGLEASTVTPGRTAPDESRTTPVIDACCANAADGTRIADHNTMAASRLANLMMPPAWMRWPSLYTLCGKFVTIEYLRAMA